MLVTLGYWLLTIIVCSVKAIFISIAVIIFQCNRRKRRAENQEQKIRGAAQVSYPNGMCIRPEMKKRILIMQLRM